MKNYYLWIFLFFTSLCSAQIVIIPDANFKDALIGDGVDTNEDGEIQVSEAEAVLGLDVFNDNISSLEGIESFTNIEYLRCHNNQLSSLDLSQNTNLVQLICGNNQLSSLNLSQNTNLEYLDCWDNQLSSLDVSQNTNLEHLSCRSNQLTSLDVSQNTNIETLDCWDNQLTSLDVSQNMNLRFLYCYDNQLSSLDLSQNMNLLRLECYDNQLSSLNIKNGNNHKLDTMHAHNNPNLTCIQIDDDTATYPACINSFGWCKDQQAIYSEECILGVEDYNQITFTLFPNPTQEVLNIESQEFVESIRIYSVNGNLIKETLNPEIRVSELTKGLYFAQVSINGKILTKRFIKS